MICVSLAAGTLLTLAGAGFVFLYVRDALVASIGEADQSLLFWYLPILFIGIFAIMAGAGLFIRGLRRLGGKNGDEKSSNEKNR